MKSRKKEKQEKMYNIIMAISVIAIMVMYFGGNDIKLQEFGVFLIICVCALILMIFFQWSIQHQLYKGIGYAYLHNQIISSIERSLLHAGIYVSKSGESAKIVDLPDMKLELNNDLSGGKITIRNCLRLNEKLDDMAISSALPQDFVVSQCYLSDNQNNYVFEFEKNFIKQLCFQSYEEFLEFAVKTKKYELFMDARYSVQIHHLLLVGQTGCGKSYSLYCLILQMVNKSPTWNIYFADPKYSGIYALGHAIAHEKTASTVEEIILLLQKFSKEMEQRKRDFGELIIKKLDSTYQDFGLVPICMIIDEYSAFRSSLARYDKKTRDMVDDVVGNTIREGRQIGCFMILAQQQTNSGNLPTEYKENIPWKIILGKAERQTYMTALGEIPELANRKFLCGQGLLIYPPIATTDYPVVVSMPTLQFDILEAVKHSAK